jgi:GT2 family glycosyltransferase
MYIIIIYILFRLPTRHVRRNTAAPEIGCVEAKLLYLDGTVQHGGVICGIAGHAHKHFPGSAPGYYQRLQLVQSLSAVTAACLLVRRTVYDEVGDLDEEDLTVAFNDVDFCLRV